MRQTALCIALALVVPSVAAAQSMPNAALEFLDSDGDVQVSRDEIVQQMDLFFEPMDTNGNGKLEFSEVETFMSRDVFDGADGNRNGSISKSEYRAQVLNDFDAADVDGNGVLN